DHFSYFRITLPTHEELCLDEKQIRVLLKVELSIGEFLAQMVEGWKSRGLGCGAVQRDKLSAHKAREAFDELLFTGEVVVQRRDVYASAVGDGAGPQAFKSGLRDDVEGGLEESEPA